jgi:hypothetical protein
MAAGLFSKMLMFEVRCDRQRLNIHHADHAKRSPLARMLQRKRNTLVEAGGIVPCFLFFFPSNKIVKPQLYGKENSLNKLLFIIF